MNLTAQSKRHCIMCSCPPQPSRQCTTVPCWDSTSDVESRRRLRSGSTSTLLVSSTRRATLGDRAFPVAGAQAWNALPSSVRTSSMYIAFRRQLKTLLFKAFFEDRTWLHYLLHSINCKFWHNIDSIFCDSVTIILTFIIIIIIIIAHLSFMTTTVTFSHNWPASWSQLHTCQV